MRDLEVTEGQEAAEEQRKRRKSQICIAISLCYFDLNSVRRILPVLVFGSSFTNSILRGYL